MIKNLIHLALSVVAFSLAYSIAFLTEIEIVKNAVLYAFIIQWILFIPAYLLQTEKFYDLSGSFTYVFIACYVSYNYYLLNGVNIGNVLIAGAIIIWAIRLGSSCFLELKKLGRIEGLMKLKLLQQDFL